MQISRYENKNIVNEIEECMLEIVNENNEKRMEGVIMKSIGNALCDLLKLSYENSNNNSVP